MNYGKMSKREVIDYCRGLRSEIKTAIKLLEEVDIDECSPDVRDKVDTALEGLAYSLSMT